MGLIALAVLFDDTTGFHDSANSIATVVATRVLRPRWAVVWAAGWNFVVFAALLGAVTWNSTSWHLGLPTSSSHALVGGLVGAGLLAGGVGALVMLVLRALLHRADVPTTKRRFRLLQLVSSAAVSFGHGGNDAQKTMGVIAALLVSTGHLTGGAGGGLPIPDRVAVLAHLAIAAGTTSGGWRIVRTTGHSITHLRPVSGFAAETSAAIALFGSTALGAPVSTTHTVAGAITGVGTTNRGSVVHRGVFGRLVIAWVITMPAAGLVAAAAYLLTTWPPTAVSAVVMTAVLVALVALLVVSLRHAPTATDVEPAEDEELPVPLRPGAGSVIDARAVPESGDVRDHAAAGAHAGADARRARQRQPL